MLWRAIATPAESLRAREFLASHSLARECEPDHGFSCVVGVEIAQILDADRGFA
jgi:hypothetical protein